MVQKCKKPISISYKSPSDFLRDLGFVLPFKESVEKSRHDGFVFSQKVGL